MNVFYLNDLTNIEIPNSVKRIGERAFAGNQLTSIKILNKDTTLAPNAFDGNQSNPDDLTIFGFDPSTGKDYALANGYSFKSLNPPSDGGGAGTAPTPSTLEEHTIEENGGTISFEDVQLDIPEGAVEGNDITIEKVSELNDDWQPQYSTIISEIFDLTKDSERNFKKDITIKLPFDKSNIDLNKQRTSIYWLNEETGEWIELDNVSIDFENGAISGKVNHFTKFAVLMSEIHHQDGSYIQGLPDGTFNPEANLKRGEMATILARLIGYKGEKVTVPFKDVKANHYAYDAIGYVHNKGLMQGYNGSFRPNETITRAEVATVLANFKQLDIKENIPLTFSDSKGHWAQWVIEANRKVEIIKGYEDGTFKPNKSITRAEVVTMVNWMIKRKPIYGIQKSIFPYVPTKYWALNDIESASRNFNYFIDEKGKNQIIID